LQAAVRTSAGRGIVSRVPAGDAFSNRELDSILRKAGIKHIFLAGMEDSTSVTQTARSALTGGYRVTFIRDAIFTTSEWKWERLLRSFETAAALAITRAEFGDTAAAIDPHGGGQGAGGQQHTDPPAAGR
jgi:nicotinamidase-related amidase